MSGIYMEIYNNIMIAARQGIIASSLAPANITYYTIALTGSYQYSGRPNDVDLYWDSGSGYQYVTTLTNPPFNKNLCREITTFSIASGSAVGFIKFIDPGNCDVNFDIVLNDPACANVDIFDNCEYDLGTATGDTTHAVRIKMTPGNNDQYPPIPASFNCC